MEFNEIMECQDESFNHYIHHFGGCDVETSLINAMNNCVMTEFEDWKVEYEDDEEDSF